MVRLGRPAPALWAAAMAVLAGCAIRQTEILEDHEDICRDHCESIFECRPHSQYNSVEHCVMECNTPNDGLWRTEACDELAEASLACSSALTCEEYNAHIADIENSPCYQEVLEISVCLVQHPLNEGP